jgi:hypothetical protein
MKLSATLLTSQEIDDLGRRGVSSEVNGDFKEAKPLKFLPGTPPMN